MPLRLPPGVLPFRWVRDIGGNFQEEENQAEPDWATAEGQAVSNVVEATYKLTTSQMGIPFAGTVAGTKLEGK